MKNVIYFCVDNDIYMELLIIKKDSVGCHAYSEVMSSIESGLSPIITTQLGIMSFELIKKGYDIFLCSKYNIIKVEEGMEFETGYLLSEPQYYEYNDIFDVFRTGYFDKLLNMQ